MSSSASDRDEQLRAELAAFEGVWKGGFYVGDPLERMFSPYSLFGYVGVYFAIYHACIRPYVGPETVALELGPGRGAWTRTMLDAAEIWCLDALSAEHNGFWDYVGTEAADRVHYVQLQDFSCRELPDDRFDYLFSFDTLCHVSFAGIEEYVRNLRSKLEDGADCFVMVADFAKYRSFVDRARDLSIFDRATSYLASPLLRRFLTRKGAELNARLMGRYREFIAAPEANGWFDAGTARMCELLERHGYTVVSPDLGLDPRSPIVHFRK